MELPRIIAYHAKILVERDGEVFATEIGRPDWEPEAEVLLRTARELRVTTVGEIVDKLQLPLQRVAKQQQGVVWGWGQSVL